MHAGDICNREVVFAHKLMTLTEAASLMRDRHVGSLVVIVDRLSERVPVGMITDRDITVGVVAKGLDPRALTVGEVMATELTTVREQDHVEDVVRLMRQRGVRRVPVLTRSGALAGLLSLDDVLDVLAEQLQDMVHTVDRERAREARARNT